MRVFSFVVLILAAGTSAAQQDVPELITDRPDQTESAVTVAPGFVQLEVGASFTHDGDADLDTFEAPGSLLRIGLVKRLELRIGWTGHVSQDVGAEGLFDESGVGDAELGVKVRLRDEQGRRPEMALLLAGSLPVGEAAFTSDRVDPSFRLALAHTLGERLGLGYNVGVEWASEPGVGGGATTLSSYLYTVALGIGLSERTGAFVELFGTVPGSASGDPAHSFDGGFTFLLRPNVQLDVAGGVALTDEADDWFVGVGVSARWPR